MEQYRRLKTFCLNFLEPNKPYKFKLELWKNRIPAVTKLEYISEVLKKQTKYRISSSIDSTRTYVYFVKISKDKQRPYDFEKAESITEIPQV